MSTPPTNYTRQFNFEDFQTINPNTPLPGASVEAEYNNVRTSLNQTILRLNEIQNPDGTLKPSNEILAQAISAASTTAASVAESTTEAYIAGNYDPTIAVQAAASAAAARADRILTDENVTSSEEYANDSYQHSLQSYNYSGLANTSRNEARQYAMDANDSKNEAFFHAQSVSTVLAEMNSVYSSALSLKDWLASESYQFVHKKEDLDEFTSNLLFNEGSYTNSLITHIFPGTYFDLENRLQCTDKWKINNHPDVEFPSVIVARDMMNCLVNTWRTFGPGPSYTQGDGTQFDLSFPHPHPSECIYRSIIGVNYGDGPTSNYVVRDIGSSLIPHGYYVQDTTARFALKANIDSPDLTGTPTTPNYTNITDQQIANIKYVDDAIDSSLSGTFTPTGTATQYIAGDGTYVEFPTMLQSGKLIAVVYNESGSTITKGTVVYISGTHGNLPSITKARANAESTSAGTYGLVETDISNMSSGNIVIAGLIENLSLNTYADGDKLYLSPTIAGEYTTTKPVAPNHLVYIGVVTRAHPTLGSIQLRIQNGFELDEIHDVLIASKLNNDLLAYDFSTGLWKNKTYTSLGLLTSITAAANYQTISGMSSYLLSSTAASTYYASSNPSGFIGDAPSDSQTYGRNNGDWAVISASASSIPVYDNYVTYTVGSQVIFDNKFWYMSTAVGAAGYDPIGYPAYWTEISSSGAAGTGTLTYSSPYIYDNATATNINSLDLSSGTLTSGQVVAGNAIIDSSGLTLTASSGAVITFADSTTQSSASHDVPTGGTMGQVLTKNSSTNYDASWSTPSASTGGGIDIQTFGSPTTSGSFTWTKPANAKFVEILLFGGGGGGGSGARWATTGNRGGGGAGAGANFTYQKINAAYLGATQPVVVGTGGNGGSSVTTNDTIGNNGTAGTATTFALYRAGYGASGAAGTSTSGGSGGSGATSLILAAPVNSSSTGSGTTAAGTTPASIANQNYTPTGGGGGAGAGASLTSSAAGGNGGGFTVNSFSATIITAIAGGAGGTVSGVAATAGTSQSTQYTQGGTGGGGGFYRTGQVTGTGGAGGWPGGGGGGGAASDNGFSSGAGGKGANGFAIIITYT